MNEKKYRIVIHKPLEALMIVKPTSSQTEVVAQFNWEVKIARFSHIFLRQEADRVLAFDEDDDCALIFMIIDKSQFLSLPEDETEIIKETSIATLNLSSLGIGILTDIGDLLSDIGASYLKDQSELEED